MVGEALPPLPPLTARHCTIQLLFLLFAIE